MNWIIDLITAVIHLVCFLSWMMISWLGMVFSLLSPILYLSAVVAAGFLLIRHYPGVKSYFTRLKGKAGQLKLIINQELVCFSINQLSKLARLCEESAVQDRPHRWFAYQRKITRLSQRTAKRSWEIWRGDKNNFSCQRAAELLSSIRENCLACRGPHSDLSKWECKSKQTIIFYLKDQINREVIS